MKIAARHIVKMILIFLLTACHSQSHPQEDPLKLQHETDSSTEATIDSAYAVIKSNCDTMLKYNAPAMADSIMKSLRHLKNKQPTDSLLNIMIDSIMSINVHHEVNNQTEKAKMVIKQLNADCDSNLRKETYNKVRQRMPAKQ